MDWNGLINLLPAFLDGTWLSVRLFCITLIFALPLGMVLTRGRMSRQKWLSSLVAVFQWIIRGTPLMLQLVVVMYFPSIVLGMKGVNRFAATNIAFIINYAAYFSEIYRSGIESLPAGQLEGRQIGRASCRERV